MCVFDQYGGTGNIYQFCHSRGQMMMWVIMMIMMTAAMMTMMLIIMMDLYSIQGKQQFTGALW